MDKKKGIRIYPTHDIESLQSIQDITKKVMPDVNKCLRIKRRIREHSDPNRSPLTKSWGANAEHFAEALNEIQKILETLTVK